MLPCGFKSFIAMRIFKENNQAPLMKRFFNSPWPLIVVMTIGTVVALATSLSFITAQEVDAQTDKAPSAQLSNEEQKP